MGFLGPARTEFSARALAGVCSIALLSGLAPMTIGPALAAGTTPLPGFYVTPSIGVQESYTDNALLTPTNKQFDFVTRALAGLSASLNSGPATGTLTSRFSYDQYARNNALSGWSLKATGNGSYQLVKGFLSLDAAGDITNGNLSEFGTSAIDRSGTANRIQLTTYDIGPHITTRLDDFADLDVVGHFAQVLYSAANSSTVTRLPSNAIIGQVNALADTGQRFVGFESKTAASYERDDHNFELVNGIQSLFVRILPQLRLIGRAGYERVTQPGVVNISAPVLSAGFELTINQQSHITFEGGTRYKHTNWRADAYLQLSDRLYATAEYREALEPPQIQLNNSFNSFLVQSQLLPTPLAPTSYAINGNLYNQTSLNKMANAHLVYTWQGNTVDMWAQWSDQHFVPAGTNDRTLFTDASYSRQIHPDLEAEVTGEYSRTFSSPIYGTNQTWLGKLAFRYTINPTMDFTAGYAYGRHEQSLPIVQTITENVAFAAIQKRF